MKFYQSLKKMQNEQKLKYRVALIVDNLRIQTYHIIKQNAENMVSTKSTSKYPNAESFENIGDNKSGFHKSTRCYNDLCMLK
jgi:hypothetical protein